ncbi:hypothetical protein TASIC1_0006051400 [Trichoderma asperellum]|uniref:Fatty acid hydroxylase domain-containing protein n=1 Tax=Trichoderma asperellum TaxID=101201 RepID=A0A6V8QUM3_TRIAP|nr:hypothetical protein TASIC1_0006051400 [Trichoderma asperellum]
MLFTFFSRLPLSVKVWAVQQVAFHVIGLVFEWLDSSNALSKIRAREADTKPYKRMLPKVLLNQCLVLLPCMALCEATGLCFTNKGHISTGRAVLSLPVLAIGHDVVQYLTHRYLLHQPNLKLMRMLRHSVHHSTTASKGISACYMSAPDFFLEIVLPYLVPLALVGGGGADLRFHSLVVASGAFGGIYEHSGYDLALAFQAYPRNKEDGWYWKVLASVLSDLVSTRAHHEHHSRGQVSFSDGFGSPGICDTIFGTRWDLVPRHRDEVEREWRSQTEQQQPADLR